MSGRASGPVLTPLFLFVPDHSAAVDVPAEDRATSANQALAVRCLRAGQGGNDAASFEPNHARKQNRREEEKNADITEG